MKYIFFAITYIALVMTVFFAGSVLIGVIAKLLDIHYSMLSDLGIGENGIVLLGFALGGLPAVLLLNFCLKIMRYPLPGFQSSSPTDPTDYGLR